jgi:hypothetical protein
MIHLSQPALALHAHDLVNIPKGFRTYLYKMQITWNMPKGMYAENVVNWIEVALGQTPEQRLNHVVINCHGDPGVLYVGGELSVVTLNVGTVGCFGRLGTKEIGTIWLTACRAARGFKGEWFCSEMAKLVGCDVVAATDAQFVEDKFYQTKNQYAQISELEGTAYRFSPSGKKEVFSIHDVQAERGTTYNGLDGKQPPPKPCDPLPKWF